MSPFEALYDRRCHTPMSWRNMVYRVMVGLKFLKEMEEKDVIINQNIRVSQDGKNSYASKNRVHKEFKVGDHVFLKFIPQKSSLKLGGFPVLGKRHCGPSEILERKNLVAYRLVFPVAMHVHDVFHVSLIKKYVPTSNHMID